MPNYRVEVDRDLCKGSEGCGICIAFCPQKVLEPDRDGKPIIARPDDCTQCAFCWTHCPDLAIISNEK